MVPPIAVPSAMELDDSDMATVSSSTASKSSLHSTTISNSTRTSSSSSASSSSAAAERDNRWLALEAVAVDAATVWPQLPVEYQQSREFIIAALEKSPTLPPKALFERTFPADLKRDSTLVLKFAQRPDFISIVQERHLYVSPEWTNHKEIMLAYCAKIPRALQDCSDALCDDPEIVQVAVALDGMALQYASPRIRQEHLEIVRQACLKDGRALQFVCTPAIPAELAMDRDFLLHVVSQPDCGSMYREILQSSTCDMHKNDTKLLCKAIEHGLHYRFWPRQWQEDGSFLLHALATLRASIYTELPKKQQQEFDVAWATLQSAIVTKDVFAQVWDRVPELGKFTSGEIARRVATLMIDLGTDEMLHTWASQQLPSFRHDRSIFRALVQRQGPFLERAAPELQRDWDLVQAAFGPTNHGCWNKGQITVFLSILGDGYIADHPELLALATDACCPTERAALWYHWSRNMNDVVIDILADCKEAVLAFARIMGTPRNLGSFVEEALDEHWNVVMTDWGEEPSFVRHLARVFPKALRCLDNNSPMWKDWEFCQALASSDCALLARGLQDDHSPQALEFKLRAVVYNPECLYHFPHHFLNTQVRRRLYNRRGFEIFLRAMDIPDRRTTKRSTLSYLDRADMGIKHLIAAYAGIPVGEELQVLRQAAVHVCFPKDIVSRPKAAKETNKTQSRNSNRSSVRGSRPAHRGMRLADMLRERSVLDGYQGEDVLRQRRIHGFENHE